jgi:hypothetical protein
MFFSTCLYTFWLFHEIFTKIQSRNVKENFFKFSLHNNFIPSTVIYSTARISNMCNFSPFCIRVEFVLLLPFPSFIRNKKRRSRTRHLTLRSSKGEAFYLSLCWIHQDWEIGKNVHFPSFFIFSVFCISYCFGWML